MGRVLLKYITPNEDKFIVHIDNSQEEALDYLLHFTFESSKYYLKQMGNVREWKTLRKDDDMYISDNGHGYYRVHSRWGTSLYKIEEE